MDKYWVEFEAAHARKIIESNGRDQEAWCDADFSDHWCKSMEGRIWAYTLMVDDIPVACVGLILQDWGKAEAWVLFSDSFKDHILTIYRIIKVGLKMAFSEKNLSRIQATIDTSYPETVRWIESLGFEYEGRLKKYGPPPQHSDFLMYARVN